MATTSIEERLAAVEAELAELKTQVAANKAATPIPWWEQRFGAFANSKEYEEAARLGRKYRESLRPKDYDDREN